MKNPVSKLSIGARGAHVKAMHSALFKLGFSAPHTERSEGRFGLGTQRALVEFQRKSGLPQTGTLNTYTANNLINDARRRAQEVFFAGQLLKDEKALSGAAVSLVQPRTKEPLATAKSNSKGNFELGSKSTPIHFDSFEDVMIEIHDGKESLILRMVMPRLRAEERLVIDVAPFVKAETVDGATIGGVVRYSDGKPAQKAKVTLFAKSLRSEEPLFALRTNDDGTFRFVFPSAQDGAKSGLQLLAEHDKGEQRSDVLHGVDSEEWIDLTFDGDVQGMADFDAISNAIAPILGKMNPAALVETEDQKDITYLSDQLNLPFENILRFAVAHRLEKASNLPADHLFGLMKSNVVGPVSTDSLDGTPSEIDAMIRGKLLYSLTDTANNTLSDELKRAGELGRIVPPSEDAIAASIKTVDGLRNVTTAEQPYRRGKASLSDLLAAAKIPLNVRNAFVTQYARTNDTSESLAALKGTVNANRLKRLELVLETGDLAQNHLPLVDQLLGSMSNKIENLYAMARLDQNGWAELLAKLPENSRVPDNILMSSDNLEKATQIFAETLKQRFTNRYPTQAYAGELDRLGRDEIMPLQEQTALVLERAPDFDLIDTHIPTYIAENGHTVLKDVANPKLVVQNLMTMQRTARLAPSTGFATKLITDGLTSARKIRDLGRQQFLRTYADDGSFERSDAFTVLRRADLSDATATAVMGNIRAELQEQAFGGLFKKSGGDAAEEIAAAEIETILPSYRTLFGSTDFCECEHCRSVLSPAAYLADTLRFLSFRGVTGSSETAKDRLFNRRPDIGHILLNCKNTNTPLPYIDLVNEHLEEWIAPGVGPAATLRQTTWDAGELRLLPEHVNGAAYDTLKTSIFPIGAPFDVDHAEAVPLLDLNGTTHLEFLEKLERGSGAEWVALGLSGSQRDVILGSSAQGWRYWGVAQSGNSVPNPLTPEDPGTNVTGSWLSVLRHVPSFLYRSGLSYKALLRLLQTSWLERFGVGVEMLDPNLTDCDLNNLRLVDAGPEFFHAAQIFLRLMKATGLQMIDLDRLMKSMGIRTVNLSYLNGLGAAVTMMHRLKVDAAVVAAFKVDIDTHIYEEIGEGRDWGRVPSTYERVFSRPDVDPDGTIFPTDAATLTGTLSDATTSLMSALSITETDLTELRKTLGLVDLVNAPARSLNITNLSKLYRATMMKKALGLTTATYADMTNFFDDGMWGGPRDTRLFVRALDKFDDAGFDLAELASIVVVGESDLLATPVSEADIESYVTTLQTAQKGVREIAALGATPSDQVAALLPLWPGMTQADDLATALSIIDDTYAESIADRATYLDRVFADLQNAGSIATVLGPINLPAGPAHDAAVTARQDWIVEQITRFQLREMTRQSLIEFLPAAADLAEVLISSMVAPGMSETILATLLSRDISAPDAADPVLFANAATREHLPNVFAVVELAARASHVVTALAMSAADCTWLLNNAQTLGLLNLNQLPTLANLGKADISLFSRTLDLFRFSDDMQLGETTLIELLDAAIAGQPVADLEAMLVDVLAMDASDAAALAQISGLTSIASYLDGPNYDILRRTAKQAMRMSALPSQLDEWGVTAFDAPLVKSLRDTSRAHLGEVRWTDKGGQLQDALRNAKRDAMVDYLIANPTGGVPVFSDQGIFDHLLVDAEMDACFITSRIKLAMSTVQLFVQRCMFAIEPDIDTSEDNDEVWGQWAWMKNYRVWEANRKVFLFPENWIEPELRLDKSPLFRMLEEELTQAPVTRETSEKAIANYLDRLSEIGRLEIVAHYYENEGGSKLLHVFGRTHTSPRVYFHRTRDFDTGIWGAWQQIDLEIEADHLIPVVWNRRMQLFWPRFTTELVPEHESATDDDMPDQNDPYVRIQLMHSEMRDGAWSPARQLDGNFLRSNHQPDSTFHFKAIKTNSPELPGRQDLSIRVAITSSAHNDIYVADHAEDANPYIVGDFLFQGRVDRPVIRNDILLPSLIPYDIRGEKIDYPFAQTQLNSPRTSHLNRQHFSSNRATTVPTTMDVLQSSRSTANNLTVFDQAQTPFEITVPHQFTQFGADTAFFYQDATKSYFVQPVEYYWNGRYFVTDVAYPSLATARRTRFIFQTFSHPFVDAFQRELDSDGIEGLYRRSVQVEPWDLPGTGTMFDFDTRYDPTSLVEQPYPIENVDFTQTGAYSLYNWELFFHTPFFIANQLSTNQRFEEAMEFYHLIFNPTGRESGDVPQRFWVTSPFFEATKQDTEAQRIQNILLAVSRGDADMIQQISAWRQNPFEPHLIATMRPAAYQKSIVFKYIRNMLDWGDQLFRRDSIESINEASQIYMMAAAILGVPAEAVPSMSPDAELSFNGLESSLDDFSNALLEVENLVGGSTPSTGSTGGDPMPRLEYFYFCVPSNDRLGQYRSIVSDRLHKIRNCMNIDGVRRSLALFEPPIDPAALVKAFASGGGVGDALSSLSAKRPAYRFSSTIKLAYSVADETERLGADLLNALQNRDAEALAVMRNGHVQALRKQSVDIFDVRISEAELMRDSLQKNHEATDARRAYFDGLSNWNGAEVAWASLLGLSMLSSGVGTVLQGISASSRSLPDFTVGAAGAMGSPVALTTFGGGQVHSGLGTAAEVLFNVGGILAQGANMSLTIAGFERRAEDWAHEVEAAEVQMEQLELSIGAANERIETLKREQVLAETELDNLETEGDYLESKFTNTQLYDWMVSRLSALHFQSYQLAYDIARQAEECFRFEHGVFDTSYVQFGHWNSLYKGLLAGKHISRDLKRMEAAYKDQDDRSLELRRHVSLAQLDPVALHLLKTTGECFVTLPEALFDHDYPGHYGRRMKSVSCTIPAVVGPYSGVNCTLELLEDTTRISSSLEGGYAHAVDGDGALVDDARFVSGLGGIQAIATSHGQDDRGMFTLNFQDERYLPFEGAGVVSRWRIRLDRRTNRFDLDTVSDFILHVDYTAHDAGEILRDAALADVVEASSKQGVIGLSAASDFAADWRRFLSPDGSGQDLSITLDKHHLPWVYGEKDISITSLTLVLNFKSDQDYIDYEDGTSLTIDVTPPNAIEIAFQPIGEVAELLRPTHSETFAPAKSLGTWRLDLTEVALNALSNDLTVTEEEDGVSFLRIDPDKLEDITLLFGFEA